jgi:hypothetical protein
MSANRLTNRGANANLPARLPSLQTARVADPQVQRALESLREWVEVRLGARGDRFERAMTMREFEQIVGPIQTYLRTLGRFDGTLTTLRPAFTDTLPTEVSNGGFAMLESGDLYFGVKGAWKKVTLT